MASGGHAQPTAELGGEATVPVPMGCSARWRSVTGATPPGTPVLAALGGAGCLRDSLLVEHCIR